MPTIRVRGVKSYRSKGRLYHYHRTTGIRIEIDIEASPERFCHEYESGSSRQPVSAQPKSAKCPMARTLGGLFDAWRHSEEWREQEEPQTRLRPTSELSTLQAGALAAVVRAHPLEEFSAPFVVSLRDAVAKRQKRWMTIIG